MKTILFLTTFFIFSSSAFSLPLYTARSGRTCNNCHSSPKQWQNPTLKKRKCTLSCASCHVDPTGGGLRNVSGVFYGKAALPHRSPFYTPKSHHEYEYSVKAAAGEDIVALKKALNDAKTNSTEENPSPQHKPVDLAWGSPLNGSSDMAFDQGRYNGLNADPMLRVGLDARLALWQTGGDGYIFPMQFDTQVAFRPYKHFTLYMNSGVLAKYKGFSETADQPNPYKVKDAFAMFSQLPYMGYVKVGSFVPPFGTRTDDHTSPIRRDFELNQDILNSRVSGIEIGAAPNYPFINFAYFKPNKKDSIYDGDSLRTVPADISGVDGHGAALSAGYRDVAGGLGVSYMTRRRELIDGGDTNSYSVFWYLNPWFVWEGLPLTYQGEVSFGDYQRAVSVNKAHQYAVYQELSYRYSKLINGKFKYDFSELDKEIRENEESRISLGVDINLFAGYTLTGYIRNTSLASSASLSDVIIYLHAFW